MPRIKRYLVRPNDQIDAPTWWGAARDNVDIAPMSLRPLILGVEQEVEIGHEDLRWCKNLPHWDGLDGFPLSLYRVQ